MSVLAFEMILMLLSVLYYNAQTIEVRKYNVLVAWGMFAIILATIHILPSPSLYIMIDSGILLINHCILYFVLLALITQR